MLKTSDASIQFCCPNGHGMRTSVQNVGKKVRCPVCHVCVTVEQANTSEAIEITDTAVCRLLTESDADRLIATSTANAGPSPAMEHRVPASKQKYCPRCTYPIVDSLQVCPDCRLLLETSSSVFRRIYRSALRSLRGN